MSSPFIGEIRPFAGNFAPQPDWHFCDGSLLSVSMYQALYSLIGVRFGGDGVNTFGLPDLRSRVPVGEGQGTGLTNRAFATKGGNEAVQLAIGSTPVHSHPLNVSTLAATSNSPANMLYANPAPDLFYSDTNTGQQQVLNSDTVTTSGGNLPHENRMPTMAISYIICINGIYPQRPQ